jgi:hypothetical protein
LTLALNKERLALCYDFLEETVPFCDWNMPPSEHVEFRLVRSLDTRGWYNTIKGKHVIAISTNCVGTVKTLFEVMAHEMVHLHQADVGMETPHAQHNRAWHKLADKVCQCHGYDRLLF